MARKVARKTGGQAKKRTTRASKRSGGTRSAGRGAGKATARRGTKSMKAGQRKAASRGRSATRTSTSRRGVRQSRTDGLLRSTKRAKWIETPDEHEDRPGQTLATRSHEVIMRWAEERQAQPATIPGTAHEGRVRTLRFNFPGYGGKGLEAISWEEWFEPFDERQLVFLFQEHKRDGAVSNFFKLDNPEREDG